MNVASTFGRIHYLSSLFDIHCVVVATLFAWTHFVGGHSSVQSTQTHRPQSSISTRPWVLLCWMQEHRALLITHMINERQQQKIKKKTWNFKYQKCPDAKSNHNNNREATSRPDTGKALCYTVCECAKKKKTNETCTHIARAQRRPLVESETTRVIAERKHQPH